MNSCMCSNSSYFSRPIPRPLAAGQFIAIIGFPKLVDYFGQIPVPTSEATLTSTKSSLPSPSSTLADSPSFLPNTETPTATNTLEPTKTIEPTTTPRAVNVSGSQIPLEIIDNDNVVDLTQLYKLELPSPVYIDFSHDGSSLAIGVSSFPDGLPFTNEVSGFIYYSQISILDPWRGEILISIELDELANYMRFAEDNTLWIAGGKEGCNNTGACESSKFSLWSISDNKEISQLEVPGNVFTLSQDHQQAIVGICGWYYDYLSRKDFCSGMQITIFNIRNTPPLEVEQIGGVKSFDKAEGRGVKVTIPQLSISNDDFLIAYGLIDNSIQFWNDDDSSQILKGHTNNITSLAFSPDNSLLASGSDDKTIRIWRTSNQAKLYVLEGHKKGVTSLTFSPDASLLASGSADGTVRLWRMSDGSLLRTIESGDTDMSVLSLSFSPDGQLLIFGGSKNPYLYVWGVPQ